MNKKIFKAVAICLAGLMIGGTTSVKIKAVESTNENTTTIHIAGDSTVKTYSNEQMIGGWGEMISRYIDTDKVNIRNYSEGGRSARSFINEGRLIDNGNFTTDMVPKGMGAISNNIKSGDYLIIQFGHNDDDSKGYSTLYDRMDPLGTPDANGIYPTTEGKKVSTSQLPKAYIDALNADEKLTDVKREETKTKALKAIQKYGDTYYSYDCGGTYKWYLKEFIKFARENGATPILVTPVSRRYFDENGKISSQPGHHGGSDDYWNFRYVEAVKQVAKEENVILIDLFKDTKNIYESLGTEDSQYIQSLKNEAGSRIDDIWIDGYNKRIQTHDYYSFDNTHQNKFGAFLFAGKLAEEIKKLSQSKVEGGINGNIESIDEIADCVYEKPSSYIYSPDILKGRLDDIASLYTLVQPIEGKENQNVVVPENHDNTANKGEITVVKEADKNENDDVNQGEELETTYDDIAKTGDETGMLSVCAAGIILSMASIVLLKRKIA